MCHDAKAEGQVSVRDVNAPTGDHIKPKPGSTSSPSYHISGLEGKGTAESPHSIPDDDNDIKASSPKSLVRDSSTISFSSVSTEPLPSDYIRNIGQTEMPSPMAMPKGKPTIKMEKIISEEVSRARSGDEPPPTPAPSSAVFPHSAINPRFSMNGREENYTSIPSTSKGTAVLSTRQTSSVQADINNCNLGRRGAKQSMPLAVKEDTSQDATIERREGKLNAGSNESSSKRRRLEAPPDIPNLTDDEPYLNVLQRDNEEPLYLITMSVWVTKDQLPARYHPCNQHSQVRNKKRKC